MSLDEFGDELLVIFQKNSLKNEVIASLTVIEKNVGREMAVFEISTDHEYSILDENYNDRGMKFISFYTTKNETVGLLLDSSSEQFLHTSFLQSVHKNDTMKENLPFYYCISFARTFRDKFTNQVKAKAIAICSAHAHFYCFKGLLRRALDLVVSTVDGKSRKYEKKLCAELYHSICNLNLRDIPTFSSMQKRVWRYSIEDGQALRHKISLSFKSKMYFISIPLALEIDEIGDERVSLTKLISKFKLTSMDLFNAILQQKRILFFGQNISAGEACFYVLSACLFVCPPLKGLLKQRVFPYQTLNDTSFTQV